LNFGRVCFGQTYVDGNESRFGHAICKIPRPDNLSGYIGYVDDLSVTTLFHQLRPVDCRKAWRFCIGVELQVPMFRSRLIDGRRPKYRGAVNEDIESAEL